MGFLSELKKLTRPYDDEDDEFEDFTPRAPEKIPVTPRTAAHREYGGGPPGVQPGGEHPRHHTAPGGACKA